MCHFPLVFLVLSRSPRHSTLIFKISQNLFSDLLILPSEFNPLLSFSSLSLLLHLSLSLSLSLALWPHSSNAYGKGGWTCWCWRWARPMSYRSWNIALSLARFLMRWLADRQRTQTIQRRYDKHIAAAYYADEVTKKPWMLRYKRANARTQCTEQCKARLLCL